MRLCLVLVLGVLVGCGDAENPASGGSGGEASGGHGGAPLNAGGAGGSGGDEPLCEAPANPSTELVVGGGEECFEPLAAGQTVPLMQGPQGGYHVWLSIGCSTCGASPIMRYGVKDPATLQTYPETYESQSAVDLKGADWPQRAGLAVTMPGISWDPENYPPLPPGTALLLYADHLDKNGNVLSSASVEVVLGETLVWNPCEENPEDPFCQTG